MWKHRTVGTGGWLDSFSTSHIGHKKSSSISRHLLTKSNYNFIISDLQDTEKTRHGERGDETTQNDCIQRYSLCLWSLLAFTSASSLVWFLFRFVYLHIDIRSVVLSGLIFGCQRSFLVHLSGCYFVIFVDGLVFFRSFILVVFLISFICLPKNFARQTFSLPWSQNCVPIYVFQVHDTVDQGMKSPMEGTPQGEYVPAPLSSSSSSSLSPLIRSL